MIKKMSYWDSIHKNLEKNLNDSNEILPHEYEYDDKGKQRKLESLFGITKKIPRQEWVEKEQKEEEAPKPESEKWEKRRKDLQEYSERDRAVAYKRDELAEVDDEGYRYTPESPAFREGFQNTLRIKPPQNPDLHNGKELNVKGKALETFFSKQDVKSKPSEKPLKPLEIQKDNTRLDHDTKVKMNTPDIKTVRRNKHDLKIKQLFKNQSNVEAFIPNKKGVRKTLLKRDLHEKTLASFVLKALFTENNFGLNLTEEDKQNLKSAFKNGEVEIDQLGKAFVELGFVLTPEYREESKRNEFDTKSFDLGKKIMVSMEGTSCKRPEIEESLKPDMALAIGRTMNNLKSLIFETKGKLNEFTYEKTKKMNQIENIGKITLQVIDGLNTKMKQKGSTSYFRTENNIENVQLNTTNTGMDGIAKNPSKSVWDALEKNIPNKTTRDILPARPDYL